MRWTRLKGGEGTTRQGDWLRRLSMGLVSWCRGVRRRVRSWVRGQVAIQPGDHAFASGQVHLRQRNLAVAIWKTGSFSGGLLLRSVWRQFAAQAMIGDRVRLSVTARLINLDVRERVVIKPEAVVRGIIRNETGGFIEIGSGCYIGDNVLISATDSVVIEDWTLIAHGVQVFDNDTHPMDPAEREGHFKRMLGHSYEGPLHIASAPVRIGRRCWIGMNSLVMKGVTMGDDTVVAAGSVVTRDLPACVIAAGNPAKPIKSI